jgi:hypothetical protein
MKQIKNQVRQAIIAAVQITGPRKGSELVRIGFGEGDWAWIPSITLADVLLTAYRRGLGLRVREDGEMEDTIELTGAVWNLSKPLEDQEESVWRFLHKVLVEK